MEKCQAAHRPFGREQPCAPTPFLKRNTIDGHAQQLLWPVGIIFSPTLAGEKNTTMADRDNSAEDRSWWNRAGDEMLSWMGDDYATRRRHHDGTHAGKGPESYRRTDDRIREDVNDRLTDKWNVDASDIEVHVVDGEVVLSGFVSDRYQKRAAEDAAESVRGVRNVENRLRIQPYNDNHNVNLIP
jgi:osmotically-inducible protein OsmY